MKDEVIKTLKSYGDILSEPWPPLSSVHSKMELNHRAKIFLPFAALTGYEEALEKAEEECISELVI